LFEGTGNILQQSANLFWDNTNGRLGIGNTSPSQKLDILGTNVVATKIKSSTNTGAAAYQAFNDVDSSYEFGMWGSTRTGYGAISPGNAYLYGSVDLAITSLTNIKFGVGVPPSERMRITNTGNFLINTTTDAGYKLDVNGTARVVSDANISGFTVGRGGGLVVGNTVVGFEAGLSNTTGNITAFGYQAGKANTTGSDNNAFGYGALRTASTAHFCVAFGTFALRDNTASNNVAIGGPALLFNTTGQQNCGLGNNSLRLNLTGNNNVAVGNASLRSNTSSNNVAIGFEAGYNGDVNANTTGSNNIFVGYQSIGVSATESNRTWIGNSSTATTWLGGSLLIGTKTDAASSICTIESTTKGFLPPRMTTTQKNAIATPAAGLVVYDTTLGKLCVRGAAAWETITSV
jgi:hypothetical protein